MVVEGLRPQMIEGPTSVRFVELMIDADEDRRLRELPVGMLRRWSVAVRWDVMPFRPTTARPIHRGVFLTNQHASHRSSGRS